MTKQHKSQPSYGQDDITKPWEPISDEMQKGLELAAYICRMYGEGDVWAQTILAKGEQIRGMWWMEKEKLNEAKRLTAQKAFDDKEHKMIDLVSGQPKGNKAKP